MCQAEDFTDTLVSSHYNPVNEVGTAIPILQMRIFRQREVKSPAGGHTASDRMAGA